jgi:hypothetical protein
MSHSGRATCALLVLLALASAVCGQIITTVAGNGTGAFSGDGGPATAASLWLPLNVAVDGSGNFFIADAENHRVRRVDASTGIITTAAGNGAQGFSGDGGSATAASLYFPWDVALDNAGKLFIVDSFNNRIRRVDANSGIITTVAGNGAQGFSGDGGPATAASLFRPQSVALDSSGNLFIADSSNSRIRKVNASTGIITTVAGNGTFGFSGDGGPATAASMWGPASVALDSSGNLFFSDIENHRIRRVAASTGIITTVAGTGTSGYSGDGGPATAASFTDTLVAIDGSGNLFIPDKYNYRVRRVDASTGIITTVAGTGTSGYSGDGGPATAAALNQPQGAAVDSAGNLFIVDNGNNRIRRVGTAGTGTTSPAPTLSLLAPGVANAGDPAFTLTVNGTGFVSTSVVQWNGSNRITTFISSTQLTAAIPAPDIAGAGTAAVAVFTPAPGGGTSASVTFFVTAPSTFPLGQLRYWPHIVTGNGYVTKMTITNLTNAQNNVVVYFVSQAGATMETDSYSLPPAGTVRFATPESARFTTATTKWAIINSQAAVGINLFFEVIQVPNSGIVANTVGFNDSPPLADFTIPVEFQPASSGFRTVGIACANVNTGSVTIAMNLIDQNGNNLGSTTNLNPVSPSSTGPLVSFGQTAADLQGTFGAFLPPSNFLGSLIVHATAPVSCIGLEDDLGLFSATPPIPGAAR